MPAAEDLASHSDSDDHQPEDAEPSVPSLIPAVEYSGTLSGTNDLDGAESTLEALVAHLARSIGLSFF